MEKRLVVLRPDGVKEIFGLFDPSQEVPEFRFEGLEGIYEPVFESLSYVLFTHRVTIVIGNR